MTSNLDKDSIIAQYGCVIEELKHEIDSLKSQLASVHSTKATDYFSKGMGSGVENMQTPIMTREVIEARKTSVQEFLIDEENSEQLEEKLLLAREQKSRLEAEIMKSEEKVKNNDISVCEMESTKLEKISQNLFHNFEEHWDIR